MFTYPRTDREMIAIIISYMEWVEEKLPLPNIVGEFLAKLWWHFHYCGYCVPSKYEKYYE
jgi:hypothetical protein